MTTTYNVIDLWFLAREFITRALLSSNTDLQNIVEVLTNEGVGTADGFTVNLGNLNVPKESRVLHTVEVTPKMDRPRSAVYVSNFGMGSNSLHTNMCVCILLYYVLYIILADPAWREKLNNASGFILSRKVIWYMKAFDFKFCFFLNTLLYGI